MPGRFFRRAIDWPAYQAACPGLVPPPGVEPPAPDYNIAPTALVPILRRPAEDEGAGLRLAPAAWGLVPSWWTKPLRDKRFQSHNARSEGLDESAVFRGAWRHRRCLVPASGFYAWTGAARAKQAWAVGWRGADWAFLAGLWDRALIDGSELDTLALITAPPNDVLAVLDARSPVIVLARDADRWLHGSTREAAALLAPPPNDALEAWRVGPAVGNVRNQGPELLDPA